MNTTDPRPNDLLTPDEVGELLGISGHAVRAAIRRGRLRAVRAGRRVWLVRRRDIVNIEYRRDSRRPAALAEMTGKPGPEKISGNPPKSG